MRPKHMNAELCSRERHNLLCALSVLTCEGLDQL